MSQTNREIATFGGGCFWCLEAVFEQVAGVQSVVSGYSGGYADNPTYRAVCEGNTGHAEVVRVTFDPSVVSFRELLGIFFAIHDPTTLNRQESDVGTQYRSAIFYHSDEQKDTANSVIHGLEGENIWKTPVITEIRPEAPFFRAEDYHQHYFSNNPDQGYCQMVVAPKLAKFRKNFRSMIRPDSRPRGIKDN
jgi:peptide-methionine (S)-S-oxide reductase